MKEPQHYVLEDGSNSTEGDIILDTHVGSASSLIACKKLGFDYVGCEKDETIYQLAKDRIDG